MDAYEPLPSIPAREKNRVGSLSSSNNVAATVAFVLSVNPQLVPHEKSILEICSKSPRWLDFLKKNSDIDDDDNKTYAWLVKTCSYVRHNLLPAKEQRAWNLLVTNVKKEALNFSKSSKLNYEQIHSLYFNDYILGFSKSILSVMIAIQAFEPFVFYSNGYAHLKPCKKCVRCGIDGKLRYCDRCKLATYCSRECQVADWKDALCPHSELCSQLSYSYQYVPLKNGSFYLQPIMHGCTIFPAD